MRKIVDNINRLRSYFKIIKWQKKIKAGDILSSNEALKSFGKLWSGHNEDVLAMIAVLEYEFISGTVYTDEQVKAVKDILARMVTFLRKASEEWEEYEKEQSKKDH